MTKGIFASKNIYFYNITIAKGLIYLKIVFNAQKSFTPPPNFFQKQTQSLFGGLRGRRRGKFENSALAQWGKFFTNTHTADISQLV